MARLPKYFPDPRKAGPDGYLGATSRITTDLLLDAYSHGIFPWSDRPARWYSPDPRSIFDLETFRVSKRLARVLRQGRFQVTFDRAFRQVMEACHRHHFWNSWLSPSMIAAYHDFHKAGYAHSVEVWREGRLVGGLYGVQVGAFFAGESMFHRETDASKVAFAHLVEKLRSLGVVMLDSQVLNQHTANLGAIEIPRSEYLERLDAAMSLDLGQTPWSVQEIE